MFRGATRVTLDAKGRVAIPTRYRDRLAARCEGQLIVTVDLDYCLLIYPLPEWEDIERKLVRLPSLKKQSRRLIRLMLGHATEVDMDGQGRILVSRELRDFAGIDKHAMLLGQGTKFELWDEPTWKDKRDSWISDDRTELSAELETLAF